LILHTKTLEDYISRYQVDAVLWKANRLLKNQHNPVLRNDKTVELAAMISFIPEESSVLRDDYITKICKAHDLQRKSLEKMVSNAITRRVKAEHKKGRKNKIKSLDLSPKTFPFFKEFISENAKTGERFLNKIKVDKLKFVQLLSSFGFSRFETEADTNDRRTENEYNYVHITDNVISSVNRNMIIDYVEKFLREQYDFKGAECEFTDADTLITTFYDQIRNIFSKDLFARIRTDAPLIINKDKATVTYLYFKNGFVEVTTDGWQLKRYDEMDGSVWNHQMKDRNFKVLNDIDANCTIDPEKPVHLQQEYKCVFMDFVWKICGRNEERFKALCCIIGYLVHDFYAYNLKSIYFTDSTVSDVSNGRTGKTLFMKMLGEIRSYCEIHGKNFDPNDEKRYETVQMGTQLIHINDVSNKGKNRFEFEPMFNDVTEGLHVRALYMAPFRQFCKIAISGNKSLFISGDSAADRVMEFELSNFFSIKNKPNHFYKQWFGRDWDKEEWNRFDNFICMCSQLFHTFGLSEPPIINLNERKLLDQTAKEFITFWDEIKVELKKFGRPWEGYVNVNATDNPDLHYALEDFIFDRKKLHDKFIHEYEDFKNSKWFTVRKFNTWVDMFAQLRLGVNKPKVWKSNGITFLQFKEDAE